MTIAQSGVSSSSLSSRHALKPSLKRTSSVELNSDRSNQVSDVHCRRKSVHFPVGGDGLERSVLFFKTSCPKDINVKNQPNLDTGISIEPDLSLLRIESTTSSSLSGHHQLRSSHVQLENVNSTAMKIQGSVLVRNLCYEKGVWIRYTIDDWHTSNEVHCCHSQSLSSSGVDYDRFIFTIDMEDVGPKLLDRTLYLAVKFEASGIGEWWDNNDQRNYGFLFSNGVQSDQDPLVDEGAKRGPSGKVRNHHRSSEGLDFNSPSSVYGFPLSIPSPSKALAGEANKGGQAPPNVYSDAHLRSAADSYSHYNKISFSPSIHRLQSTHSTNSLQAWMSYEEMPSPFIQDTVSLDGFDYFSQPDFSQHYGLGAFA